MKRFISLLLALTLFCFFTISALAAESAPSSIEPNSMDGSVAEGEFFKLSDTSDTLQVPRIEIDTESKNGAALVKEDGYVNANINIIDTDESVMTDSVLLKVHGNSTAMTYVTKKSLTFKFEKKHDVLGMGKGKKWILLANCFDPTLLRNYIVFDFARELGIPYVSQQRIVELWLDGSYHGCYTLYEPVQEGTDRVEIDSESNNGKNDFLIELEASRYEEDNTYFTTEEGLRFSIKEPEEPGREQRMYISGVIKSIISTLKNGSEAAIRQVIDTDSFAGYYLLNEYSKNADFNYSSVFFFYKDGRLYAGPPWDYDLALGNLSEELNIPFTDQGSSSAGIMQNEKNLYKWLCNEDWFLNEIKSVYARHYNYIEGISTDDGLLDSLFSKYSDVFAKNYTKWQINKRWMNYQRLPFATYNDNYIFLKNWCGERNAWLKDYYGLYKYEYLLGDADGDNEVSILDVTIIQRVLAKIVDDSEGRITLRAALNHESLDVTDITITQRFLVGIPVDYPLNEPASAMC